MSYIQVMLTWFKSWSGQFSRFLVWPLVLMSTLSLTGCGMSPLSLLPGAGTNVAANTQLGRQNNQTIGTSSIQEFKEQTVITDNISQGQNTKVNATEVQTVVVNEIPTWVVILLLLGWLLPSPGEIGRVIRGWFNAKKL